MRTLLRASLVALLGFAPLVAVPGAAALTIQGRVLKGEDRVPVAGISVSLHSVQNQQELPGNAVRSGRDGGFRFTGLKADPSINYFVSTEYVGALYNEGPITVAGKDQVTQDFVIYDVGRDLASVHVANHHIIVERKTDHLHITEIVVFENNGKSSYLGTGLNHAENVGVRIGLPASVKNFEPGMGGDAQTVHVQGRDLASVRPIPPGRQSFGFTYDVPFSARMDLSHRLYFPTEKFVVLIADPELKLESSSIQFEGRKEQGGRNYDLYQGSSFPVGAEVTMRIRGAGFWSNPKVYPWVAAPFLIIGALVFAARIGRRTRKVGGTAVLGTAVLGTAGLDTAVPGDRVEEGVPLMTPSAPAPVRPVPVMPAPVRPVPGASSDEDFSAVYLYLIDSLDRGLERGEFSAESHTLVRRNLKRRLESILSDQPRTGTR